jgi:hypothetical protein
VSVVGGVVHFEDGATFSLPEPLPSWEDNTIQFPRLLCEINATQELDWIALSGSMDCTLDDVIELFDRANVHWEMVKKSLQ